MDLEFTEEQEMIRRMARDFAQNEVLPIAAEMDERGQVPIANLIKMAKLGFLGLTVSEEYGGCSTDTVSYVLVVEELAKACASTALMVAVQNSLVCYPLEQFGTEAQKLKFLVPLAEGEKIGAFALTEPEAGSDVVAIQTKAVRDGGEYILSGLKHFITNGSYADTVLLFANTAPEKGHKGISAFIVESGTPGFSVGREEEKMGMCATSTSELIFEDCRVPVENRLGEEGWGLKIALSTLDVGRIGIAAQALGIAQAAYEAALEYAKTRVQFGQPIAKLQGIQFMLADMATRIKAARLLVYDAALAKDKAKETGARFSEEAAMAKLFASETAVWVTNRAIQIHGGYGYMKDYPVERHYRDAKITEIYEGTNEIQRIVIAGSILR